MMVRSPSHNNDFHLQGAFYRVIALQQAINLVERLRMEIMLATLRGHFGSHIFNHVKPTAKHMVLRNSS